MSDGRKEQVHGPHRSRELAIPLASTLLVAVAVIWAAVTVMPSRPPGARSPGGGTAVASPADRMRSGTWRPVRSGPNGLWPSAMFWTGDAALVFAGSDTGADRVSGAIYDPRTDRWRAIDDGGLEWRGGEAVVWTGDVMIVWGGDSGTAITKDGGVYHPATDTWRPIAEAPLPLQGGLEATWTGREMVVLTADGSGAAYDPARDAWRRMASFPLRPRQRPAAVWTGREVLVWGGCSSAVAQCDDTAGGDELVDGAAYDPARNRWRTIAPSPLAARDRPEATWTGTEMLVWGGAVSPGVRGAYGGAYDPVRDRWRSVSKGPLAPRSNHTAVWTGRQLLVWGGVDARAADVFLGDGAAYDPATDAWRPLPAAPIAGRDRHVALWTGTVMLVWGGCCQQDAVLSSGAIFRPVKRP